jgi:fructose-specific phosphotransferase system IIC component
MIDIMTDTMLKKPHPQKEDLQFFGDSKRFNAYVKITMLVSAVGIAFSLVNLIHSIFNMFAINNLEALVEGNKFIAPTFTKEPMQIFFIQLFLFCGFIACFIYAFYFGAKTSKDINKLELLISLKVLAYLFTLLVTWGTIAMIMIQVFSGVQSSLNRMEQRESWISSNIDGEYSKLNKEDKTHSWYVDSKSNFYRITETVKENNTVSIIEKVDSPTKLEQ